MPIKTEDGMLSVVKPAPYVGRAVKYRRMPPTFPAHDRPVDVVGRAELWLERKIADITEDDRDLWAGRMAEFMQEVLEPANPSDGDAQQACDGKDGHVLTVEGEEIVCMACNAMWKAFGF